jgi:hypothetical protein
VVQQVRCQLLAALQVHDHLFGFRGGKPPTNTCGRSECPATAEQTGAVAAVLLFAAANVVVVVPVRR